MPSMPLTPDEEAFALKAIGARTIDDLFSTVPPRVRETAGFDFPDSHGMSEHELRNFFRSLAEKNQKWTHHFLGGGVYDNIVPAIVNQLALRGEFLTCYTPYQPEMSQGTLAYIFEFQTLIARLTAMPVANASMYDGPTATAEAITMAQRLTPNKQSVLVSAALSPDTLSIIRTFLKGHTLEPTLIRHRDDGTLDTDHLKELTASHDPSAIVVGYPNYFGIIEDLQTIRKKTQALVIVSVPDPSALGLFEAPGRLGADIVCGEAHQFGTPMSFGGPHCGFFCARKEFIRQMPGRIVGETVDSRGQRCYTLTLSTREQHIRREKATSNICTNQGLIALRTTIYLSFLGKQGLVSLATRNYSLFEYIRERLSSVGIRERFPGATHYREGVFEVPGLSQKFQRATEHGIVPGIRLAERLGPAFENSLLICANPKHDKATLDRLAELLA